MENTLPEIMPLLERTPAALNALLRDMPAIWTLRNEGTDTWTAFDVVGHLVHGEHADWMPRVRMILQSGESQTFVPFDRWAQERESRGKSLQQLLDEFASLRSANLADLRGLNLSAEQLHLRGNHPELGLVTLAQLLSTWVVHDLTHLHQLSRIMAYQYRDAVGPWSKYLGVLRCSGHSS
jgi:hypothetical protein